MTHSLMVVALKIHICPLESKSALLIFIKNMSTDMN